MSVGKKVPGLRLHRNKFNLSHERRMSADMFFLYPVLVDDVIPGDVWRIGNEMVVRMNPLFAPIMHEINVFVHYYFVPNRLLWPQWEDFMTGGRDGKFVSAEPRMESNSITTLPGSLWDYLGFNASEDGEVPHDLCIEVPLAYPWYAYNLIYNEYYRDPNLTDPVPLTFTDSSTFDLHVRCWEKDYFTSMLPWQQRGDAPAVPIDFSGRVPIHWGDISNVAVGTSNSIGVWGSPGVRIGTLDSQYTGILQNWFDSAYIDSDDFQRSTFTFDVNDMRLMFQVQKYLERNARVGPRYVEQLRARYKSSPTDDRLQRPEYIGGSKTPIIISEVLQTSQSTSESPQGNMSGHGLSADHTYCGTYKCREHGVIMGIMSIMPKPMYMDGVDRVWLKTDKFDYPHPEFVNLSEQAVKQSEIYNYANPVGDRIIGYQGRYDEYRFKRSTVHGLFRTQSFAGWHMARHFNSPPTLNLDLVRPNSSERESLKRGMMVPSEPMFLITLGNKCHVTRSLPYMAQPGLIDHN